MYKRLSQLSFVIGLFFSIVSLILFANALLSGALSGINLYTATVFIVFGLAMMAVKNSDIED